MTRTPSSADYSTRLTAPKTLSAPERAIWQYIVRNVSSDHFQPCDRPLLVEYCRAAVLADCASKALQAGAVIDGKTSPWIAVQEKTVRSIVALAMRLRLAPQSRYDRLHAGRTTRTGVPDLDDDGLLATEIRPLTGLASFRGTAHRRS